MVKKGKTFDLILAALGAALIAICAWISIPGTVAFTLQTFAIYCILLSFGPKVGLTSIIVYVLIGAIGAPVFAGFQAGLGCIMGLTGGYIIGFIFIGLIYLARTAITSKKLWLDIAALIVGTMVCYAFGTAWFTVAYARDSGPIGFAAALSWCVIPYIIPDLAKLALAVLISRRVRKLYIKRKSN